MEGSAWHPEGSCGGTEIKATRVLKAMTGIRFCPRCRERSLRGSGGGGRMGVEGMSPSPSAQANHPKRTSVLWTMLQYLFPGIPAHIPIIKTLGKMLFSIPNQVYSPRLPACLPGARGLCLTGLGGSDGGPVLSPADTRELSRPARTAAPSPGHPPLLIFILMVGRSGPGWGAP